MQQKYVTTVEYVHRFGKRAEELVVYSEEGKSPNIGNFIDAFRVLGIEVELKDLIELEFRPVTMMNPPCQSIRVRRMFRTDPRLRKEG